MEKAKLMTDVVEKMCSLSESIKALADYVLKSLQDECSNDKSTNVETPSVKEVTLSEVRSVLAEKSHEGYTEEIRALLLKYGASKLSDIDPKFYSNLLADAEVIGHGA